MELFLIFISHSICIIIFICGRISLEFQLFYVFSLLCLLVNYYIFCYRIVSLTLANEAKQEWCMFQIWQPYHSGRHEDVWAVDDISLSSSLLNVINLNFSDQNAMNSSIRYSSGIVKKYCNSQGEAVV